LTTAARIERWVWILIYGGIALAAIGAALIANGHRVGGWAFVAFGAADVVAGIVLIVVRSRMHPPEPPASP
jgi:vacuolar-type H+-ATPase subunit I/STV1